MGPFDQVHVTAVHPVDRQAIVDVQYRIGMRLEPVCLQALLGQLLGLGLVPGHHQQVAVCLAKHPGLVAAQVDEEQPGIVWARRYLTEFEAVVVNTVDFHPCVDVQARSAPEPGLAQMWVGLFK
ncbi:hypothetical protein D9M73_241870 [compost metagenome]